jgi:hypothetical protein
MRREAAIVQYVLDPPFSQRGVHPVRKFAHPAGRRIAAPSVDAAQGMREAAAGKDQHAVLRKRTQRPAKLLVVRRPEMSLHR